MVAATSWTSIRLASDLVTPAGTDMIVMSRLHCDIHERVLLAFKPREYVFDNPADWRVLEYKLGLVSQLTHDTGVAARYLTTALRSGVAPVLHTPESFEMRVRPLRDGLLFRCTLSGEGIFSGT